MFNIESLTGEYRGRDRRPIIGAVKVNKPFTYHDNHYECAAWWEDHEAQTGVHPVYLDRSHHHPKNLIITAEIKAKVVNDYFPGLWGGVRISNEPYKPKHIGEERTIHRQIEVLDAIQYTGNSPGSDLDWYIDPSWWKVFTEEALKELREDYRRLPEFWQSFESLDESTFNPKLDGRYTFDMEYRSQVSMIAHFGSLLEKWSRRIEKISWQSRYHVEGGQYNTPYNRENFVKNTEWTKAIPIQVNQ